MQMHLNW